MVIVIHSCIADCGGVRDELSSSWDFAVCPVSMFWVCVVVSYLILLLERKKWIESVEADTKASDCAEEFLTILDHKIQREVVLVNGAGGWIIWSSSICFLSWGMGIKWELSDVVNSLVHSDGLGVPPVYVSHRTFLVSHNWDILCANFSHHLVCSATHWMLTVVDVCLWSVIKCSSCKQHGVIGCSLMWIYSLM